MKAQPDEAWSTPEPEDHRLDSWKEIASFFGRSVRTVQNWEKCEGLPAHRHVHRELGSVYAYRSELQAWEQSRDPPRRSTWSPRARGSLLAISLVATAGAALVWLNGRANPPFEQADVSRRLGVPRPLTRDAGLEDFPSWSPDGARIAYHSDRTGNFDIWIMPLDGGPSVNLTENCPEDDRFPTWSPDGSRIAFYSEREGGAYFTASSSGGPARAVTTLAESRIATFSVQAAQWSPDGEQLAWPIFNVNERTRKREIYVELQSLRFRDVRQVPMPGRSRWRFDLSWSPDGRHFAYVDAHSVRSTTTQIWVMRAEDGAGWPVTVVSDVRQPSWSRDGRTLYFISRSGGSVDIWQQRLSADIRPEGEASALTGGVGVRHAVVSLDGTRVAYSKGRTISNLWRVPISKGQPAGWEEAQQITFDEAVVEHVDISPDGAEVAFSSDRNGNSDIWILRLENADMRPFTTHEQLDWSPRWSPTGDEIAFYSNRSGNRDIWVKPVNGGSARQLTYDENADMYPTWSPDGSHIAFMSDRSGNADIWVSPATGGKARQLTTSSYADAMPEWSPNGKWVAYRSARPGGARSFVIRPSGRSRKLLTERPSHDLRWDLSAERIYYLGYGEKEGHIWATGLDSPALRQMTELVGRPGQIAGEGLATDGDYLYFIWTKETADLWLMRVLEEK